MNDTWDAGLKFETCARALTKQAIISVSVSVAVTVTIECAKRAAVHSSHTTVVSPCSSRIPGRYWRYSQKCNQRRGYHKHCHWLAVKLSDFLAAVSPGPSRMSAVTDAADSSATGRVRNTNCHNGQQPALSE